MSVLEQLTIDRNCQVMGVSVSGRFCTLAAKAVGSDTRTWVKLTESYRPDPWRGQEYTQWYEEYHQQYRSVKDQYKHIATLLERGK